MTRSVRRFVIIFSLFLVFCASGAFFFYKTPTQRAGGRSIVASSTLPAISLNELSRYDGSDPALPIYIGFEGYVYDVTEGKRFYVPGGTYHYLAGKDSTKSLRFMGGDIIRTKYPIVATISG